jgi:hemolysin activation/secretion protein
MASASCAQVPPVDPGEGRMDVSGYSIEGRLLLKSEDFTGVVSPFIGRHRTAADLERARRAVEQAYHDLGYCEVRITLARPELKDGVVMLHVSELPAAELRDCKPRAEPAAAAAGGVVVAEAPADAPAKKPAAQPGSAPAPEPGSAIPAPRFDIRGFEVTGNTLLPASELERLFEPFTGRGRDFADIQRALEALEQAYRDLGYGVVQVLLPEQDISRGVVQFRVVQPRVGKVTVEGNAHFDDSNIRRSLPTVREGEVPNSKAIARNLQLAAEHPVKQTSVLLRAGASADEVDVVINVADEKPWRGFVTLDNTGTSETGYARLGIGVQHSNLFNRDHTLTGQYVTSPTDPGQVQIYGAGYRIPFYGLNSSLDLIAGYADVDSGTVQGLFNVSGSGTVALARWNYVLPKWGDLEQKLSFGLDYRAYQNDFTVPGSSSIVPDVTVHPVSLGYGASWRGAASELSFYGNFSRNIPGGSHGREEDWTALAGSRQGVVDDYQILRYGFNYVRQFKSEWQTRIGFSGQYTSDALVAGEQFGIGGPDTVRGYLLRELAKDKGYATQVELYTPEWARALGLPDRFRLRFLAFYDYGSVENNDTTPSDRQSLASTGLGLRLGYGKTLSLRFDVAQILKDSPSIDKGNQRVSAGLALVF